MVWEIVALIIGLFLGGIAAWYILRRQRGGDVGTILKARYERQLAQTEKDYEIKLEKANSILEKTREENKTHLEKVSREWEVKLEKILKESGIKYEQSIKDWQVKYIHDIEELKKLFKESEKKIRQTSVSSSRRTLVGRYIEKFVPFLSKIGFAPADMHFLGQPVDYIVFDGMGEDKLKQIVFVEVKTGNSNLNKREKALKEVVGRKRVYWKEVRVDTSEGKKPDQKMEKEEHAVDEIYDNIDEMLESAKNQEIPKFGPSISPQEEDDVSDEEGDGVWECNYCGEEFETGEEVDTHERTCGWNPAKQHHIGS